MASSSVPFVPSPLAKEQRDTMAGPSSVSSMATPGFFSSGQGMFVPANNGGDNSYPPPVDEASSSRSRLRQSFQPYTGPSGFVPIPSNNNNNTTNSNNNFFSPSQSGVSPFSFTGSVPYIQAPPATGPCPLAETVDLASLPALDATGNETSVNVNASSTSPTGTSNQAMYGSGYLPPANMGYGQYQQSFALPSVGGESSKAVNNGWGTDASDWEDPYASGSMNDPRLSVQRPSNYGVPRQVMPTWAPQASPLNATPSSSTGSPVTPPHGAQNAPLSHPAHPKPPSAAALAAQQKVPRPPNAWILYRSDMLNQIRSGQMPKGLDDIVNTQQSTRSSSATSASEGEGKKKSKKASKESSAALIAQLGSGKAGRGLPQADISKMISLLWKKESDEVRRRYEQRAEMKKVEHQRLYPNYKFQPVRKEEKIAQRQERQKERDERRKEKELSRQRQRRRARGRGMSPHEHDEGHVVSMSRSSSYPGPEGVSYRVSYGAGAWAQANATAEESEGEAMQNSFAEPVVFDTSLLAMAPQTQGQFSMIQPIPIGQMGGQMNGSQQIGMSQPQNGELPPSPQRSNGQNLSSSYQDGSTEWTAPPPGAYIGGQLILTPPDDSPQYDVNGVPVQPSVQDETKKDQAIYVFQPPNLPPEMQVTDPEALAALWCKLEPDQFDVTNMSANPTPNYTFPTPPIAQSIDSTAWDQHETDSSSFQVPVNIGSLIMAEWNNLNPGGANGMMVNTAINYTQGQGQTPSDQQAAGNNNNSNYQGTLAPTPSFSNQVSPVDGNYARDSPLRPAAWAFVNASPNGYQNSTSQSVPRNVSGPYTAPLTFDAESGNIFGGRFDDTFNSGKGVDMGKDMMINPGDMVGPPTAYPPGMAPPNVSVGLPVSITNVPVGPAPRVVRRPRQVASKYETVAGA